jgi:hypothetical protein
MNALKLVAMAVLACVSSHACGEAVGPLPYNGPADSPFHPTDPGSSFFLEDFSTPPTVVYRQLPPYGLNYPFASLSTPGVEIEGTINWVGNRVETWGSCTNSIPASCSATLGFQFDSNSLGNLPRAIGFAVSGTGTFSLAVYDANNQLAEKILVDLDQYYDPPTPPPGEIIFLPPPPFVFLGARESDGISQIVLSLNSATFAVDDFQYGEFVPEPATQTLELTILAFIALCRFRSRHAPVSIKPAALALPCADGG